MKTLALTALLLFPASSFGQESFDSMLEGAREGKAWAQNEVGVMYSEGKGVKPNQRKAVYWFRHSAEQGDALGACNFALHYGFGWGIQKNLTLMAKWAFIGEALDALRCHTEKFEHFKPAKCHIDEGWGLSVEWLKAHPDLKNEFGERPWTEPDKPSEKKDSPPCARPKRTRKAVGK